VMASPKHAQRAHGATRALSTDLGRGNSGIIKGRCAERPITKKLSQNQRPSSFVPGSVGPPVAFATLCARSNMDGTDPTTR
jgi:hypothetical protein